MTTDSSKKNATKNMTVMRYLGFYASCVWLLLFVAIGGMHDYAYMLHEAGSEIDSWCQLPMENDPIRREMYILFLIQFIVVGLVFLRRKNHIFIISAALVFCYATHALLLKDMLCAHF